MNQTIRETPIVQFEGTEPAGKTLQVYGRTSDDPLFVASVNNPVLIFIKKLILYNN